MNKKKITSKKMKPHILHDAFGGKNLFKWYKHRFYPFHPDRLNKKYKKRINKIYGKGSVLNGNEF